MAKQLRVYTVQEGKLDDWVDLFKRGTSKLRREQGFEVQGWTAPPNQFVWIVDYPGTQEDFQAADKAYYALPEHKPLHEEALLYLAEGQSKSWFLEPLD